MNTPRILLAASLLAAAGRAQIPVFSIDWNGPTISLPDSFTGTPITEGDLLAPQPLIPALGPLPPPGIVESAGFFAPVGLGLGAHLPCVGHPPYTQCAVEVDALSHALDAMLDCIPGTVPPTWAFSVRWRAMGNFGPLPPAVWTEVPCQDEAADVFVSLGVPCGPLPPSPGFGNTARWDGDGLVSCTGSSLYAGVGLIENAPPLIYGDNLDALDDDVPDQWFPETTCTYFSLDSAFLDPFLGVNNSGSAAAHGFRGGDVLMTCVACAPSVYASAVALGLDAGGPDTDDLDALVLRENGLPGYQRSSSAYDWTTGATDMLFFSVRRGSAICGTLDSIFGLPIVPGDILVPNGPLGTPPGIWIAAEDLGLAATRFLLPPNPIDDVDALDILQEPQPGTPYCFGDGSGSPCPCANFGATGRGCANSFIPQGALLWGNGNPSLSNDHLKLTISGAPPNATVNLLESTVNNPGFPVGDGLLCLGGSISRLVARQAMCGNREFGYGVPGDSPISLLGPAGLGTYHYQVRYRDINPTWCSPPDLFNWTNGYTIVWTP